MKYLILFLMLTSCFISCNYKEKYEGKWTNWYLKDVGYNETKNVIIKNDSIEFNYPYFDNPIKYSLTIKKGTFTFNHLSFKASVEKDTLTLNNSIFFVKDNQGTLYDSKVLLKIDLPKAIGLVEPYYKDKTDELKYYMFFGKAIDNSGYKLQLNDKYARITDIPAFIVGERDSKRDELFPFPTTLLFMDKETPMKYIEDVLFNLSIVNQLKVSFVNDISLKYSDSLGLYYTYKTLQKKLPPLLENDTYNTNSTDNNYNIPPPPPPYSPKFNNESLDPKFIYLKKNKIYLDKKIINVDDIENIITPWIENKNVIICLYDLESNYGDFLKVISVIDNVFKKVRNAHSEAKFNKPLQKLNQEELAEIMIDVKKNYIWSYSIQHYNSIVEKEHSFFGLKAIPIN